VEVSTALHFYSGVERHMWNVDLQYDWYIRWSREERSFLSSFIYVMQGLMMPRGIS
jgi:hypothetical protein